MQIRHLAPFANLPRVPLRSQETLLVTQWRPTEDCVRITLTWPPERFCEQNFPIYYAVVFPESD